MTIGILQWIFLVNLVFLMMHETEAVYWREWRLFGKLGASFSDKQGLTVFVLARIPIFIPTLYGLLNLDRTVGLIISLIFSGFLIGHFIVHMLAIKQGRQEFVWPISYFVQFSLLILAIIQVIITLYFLVLIS